jgi:hypothetical protein
MPESESRADCGFLSEEKATRNPEPTGSVTSTSTIDVTAPFAEKVGFIRSCGFD